ncbi:MAG: 30S ribosome-binding factor RbfA [Myxococcales bacterium]|nr:30S ribosome-binding factor RbfA [Myxococcales bacterium]
MRNKQTPFKRTDRLGEEIRKAIGLLLLEGELRDPRLTMCSITHVKLSPDLREARISFSIIGDAELQKEAEKNLNRAADYIKNQVSRRLRLRYTPNLTFRFDPSLERAERINQLLKDALPAETPAPEEEAGDD